MSDTNAATSDVIPALWEWQNDSGWLCYSKTCCETIEKAFLRRESSCSFSVGQWNYTIDFQRMQQMNTRTSRIRYVRRSGDQGPVWARQDDCNSYRRYEGSVERALELLYNRQTTNNCDSNDVFTWGVHSINIGDMEETDPITNERKLVKRLVIAGPTSNVIAGTSSNDGTVSLQAVSQSASASAQDACNSSSQLPRLLEEGTVECLGSTDSVSIRRALTCLKRIDKKTEINDECAICLDKMDKGIVMTRDCKHVFHKACITDWATKGCKAGFECPKCKTLLMKGFGDCPKGTMKWQVWANRTELELAGNAGTPTIVIDYQIPPGYQSRRHPNPGANFTGTRRTAYLPYCDRGQRVLRLLKACFVQGHTFTVGTSVTTGISDTTVWNGVHHKTRTHGGSAHFGFPDDDYLDRVCEELKGKGIEWDNLEDE